MSGVLLRVTIYSMLALMVASHPHLFLGGGGGGGGEGDYVSVGRPGYEVTRVAL